MRRWVETDGKQLVFGEQDQRIGRLTAVELDPGTWRVLTLRVAIDAEVSERVGLKHGLLSRAVLDLPTDQVAERARKLRLEGGLEALGRLAARQGAVTLEHSRKTSPPARDIDPEPDQEYSEVK